MSEKITLVIDEDNTDRSGILTIFDKEIEEFSEYMKTLSLDNMGGELTKAERTLIKTYLVAKFRKHIT